MKAHIRYLKYVLRHKWFVFKAGIKLGVPLWQLIIHDWSKFLPSEWMPYVRKFYGGKYPDRVPSDFEPYALTQGRVDYQFNVAWNHHQKRNPHHWQYWILREDDGNTIALPIPTNYALEMLADWVGAGIAITGRNEVREWYAKNKGKIVLEISTRKFIEEKLKGMQDGTA